ncbi:type III secretion protein [Edwardsiella ictaluri]|uniref:type III secretion protein n=1 Tax=Edwardsiella ictaluri TaxID=67780 RepID=UPI0009BD8E43|nr:type III secretion protein [Edwardsiella ictaluri]ARD40552.1 type III secretion protein [Edwardsiella ictaluri]QPW26101.1 type III secretion protein [Edwardsiella ictaluri]
MNTIDSSSQGVNGISQPDDQNYISGDRSNDAIGQMDELMVKLAALFGKLRDMLRQYQQAQQNNAFKMQQTSYDTRMGSIEQDFQAKQGQAVAQILGGIAQSVGGGFGEYGHTISTGLNNMTQGIVGVGYVNDLTRKAQEGQALSDYQRGLADQLLKRADETKEKALKISGDLREILTALTQAHERLSSSVRIS